jgi:hypothetical protein
MWPSALIASLIIVLAMAIISHISIVAGIISLIIIVVMFIAIDKDSKTTGKSYSSLVGLILLSYILNAFIKKTIPFPINLVYFLLLLLVSYSAWRTWLASNDGK